MGALMAVTDKNLDAVARAATQSGLPGLDRVLIWFNDPANWHGPEGLLTRVEQHLLLALFIVAVACAIAIPVGAVIGHTGRGAVVVAGTANALRAIPGLGLLILLIVTVSPHINVATGITSAAPPGSVPYLIPVLIVLLILAIPPALSATYAGVQAVEPSVKDAAIGIGLSPAQVLVRVELPMAVPVIAAGVRSCALQVIASLSVAAYAPLIGGLGRFIADGAQNVTDPRYGYPAMLAAAITIAVMAVATDALAGVAGRHLTPRGIRGTTRSPSTATRAHTRTRKRNQS